MHALRKTQNIDMLFKERGLSTTCMSAFHHNAHSVAQAWSKVTGSWKQQQAVTMLCGFPIANHERFACPILKFFKVADMLGKQAKGGGDTSVSVQDIRATIASMQTRCQTYVPKPLTHCLLLQHTISQQHKHTSLYLSASALMTGVAVLVLSPHCLYHVQHQGCSITWSVSGGACNADLVSEADCCSGILPLLFTPVLSPLVLLCLPILCTGTVVAMGGAMGGRLEDVTKVAEANVL